MNTLFENNMDLEQPDFFMDENESHRWHVTQWLVKSYDKFQHDNLKQYKVRMKNHKGIWLISIYIQDSLTDHVTVNISMYRPDDTRHEKDLLNQFMYVADWQRGEAAKKINNCFERIENYIYIPYDMIEDMAEAVEDMLIMTGRSNEHTV